MRKVIKIKGMTCSHCQDRVAQALNGLAGVSAKVNLKKQEARVRLDRPVSDEELTQAVLEAGYEVSAIIESKGLFS